MSYNFATGIPPNLKLSAPKDCLSAGQHCPLLVTASLAETVAGFVLEIKCRPGGSGYRANSSFLPRDGGKEKDLQGSPTAFPCVRSENNQKR